VQLIVAPARLCGLCSTVVPGLQYGDLPDLDILLFVFLAKH